MGIIDSPPGQAKWVGWEYKGFPEFNPESIIHYRAINILSNIMRFLLRWECDPSYHAGREPAANHGLIHEEFSKVRKHLIDILDVCPDIRNKKEELFKEPWKAM